MPHLCILLLLLVLVLPLGRQPGHVGGRQRRLALCTEDRVAFKDKSTLEGLDFASE
jgi:hypothetical protein